MTTRAGIRTVADLPVTIPQPARPRDAQRRPRLLFLSQTLPYPPDGGVNIRTHHVLRLLASAFDVTALCFYRKRERPTAAAVAESVAALGRLARVEAFPIPQEHSAPRFVWDHLRALATRRAYTLYAYDSAAYARRLREVLGDREFDVVHLDSIDMAGYLPLLPDAPTVCVHHNVESLLLRRRAEREPSGWRRAYVALQGELTERLERELGPRFDLNIAVSPEDALGLSQLAPDGRVVVVPNGVDTTAFAPVAAHGDGLVCVGGLNGFANRDGLDYFCDSILPCLHRAGVRPHMQWVGRADAEDQERFRRLHGITLTGYVDDIRPYVAAARCFVVPLRVGGGTRVKILDAWAMGMPVVSTSLGCEGLDAVHGENILIADTPSDFAAAVAAVLSDDDLARRLGSNARRTAETHYSWARVGQTLIGLYEALITDRRRPSCATGLDQLASAG